MEISSSNLPKNSIDIAFLDLRAWQPPRQRCMGRFAVAEIPAVTKKKNASRTGFRVENAKKMVHPARFELTTFYSGGRRSIQLSYGCTANTTNIVPIPLF